MSEQTLPLPNPGDWISPRGAAAILRVSVRTVHRKMAAGRLTSYLPYGAVDAPSNHILWRPEVKELGKALALARGDK
jgi:hypothetical protein